MPRTCDGCGADILLDDGRKRFCCQACGARFWRKARKLAPVADDLTGFLAAMLGRKKGGRTKWACTIALDDLVEMWERQDGRCSISGRPMTVSFDTAYLFTNASIDRINCDRGYVKGNVRLVCLAVNIMRNCLTDFELFGWAQDIAANFEPDPKSVPTNGRRAFLRIEPPLPVDEVSP